MNKVDFFDDITKIRKWHNYLSMYMLAIISIIPFLLKFISFVSKTNLVDNFLNLSVLLSVLYFIFFIIYAPIVFRSSKFNNKILSRTLLCILLFILLNIVSYIIFKKFSIHIPIISSNQKLTFEVVQKLDNYEVWNRIIIFLYFSFLVPCVEEILFRIFAFRLLRNKIGIFSHVIIALIFAIYNISYNLVIDSNLSSLALIIPYFFKSIILSSAYERLKTPIVGVLSCLFYNFISILRSSYYVQGLGIGINGLFLLFFGLPVLLMVLLLVIIPIIVKEL